MKVLFVCQGNVVRSQIAEAIFNRLYNGEEARGAGTEAGKYLGRRLGTYAFHTVKCMREIGFDISERTARQITLEMVSEADRIIVMALRETWPDYLARSDKVEVWDVEDPAAGTYEAHVKARDDVKRRVEELVQGL